MISMEQVIEAVDAQLLKGMELLTGSFFNCNTDHVIKAGCPLSLLLLDRLGQEAFIHRLTQHDMGIVSSICAEFGISEPEVWQFIDGFDLQTDPDRTNPYYILGAEVKAYYKPVESINLSTTFML